MASAEQSDASRSADVDEQKEMRMDHLRTPAFVIDYPVLLRNSARMQERAKRFGLSFRPHVKTHKTIDAALLQTDQFSSDRRIVTSTLAEAKFFAANGFSDILYGVPVDIRKFDEIAAFLEDGVKLHILLDSHAALDALEKFAKEKRDDTVFSCFIKVDTGYHRAGVNPEMQASLRLAQRLHESSHTSFQGLYSHNGHTYGVTPGSKEEIQAICDQDVASINAYAKRLRDANIPVPTVGVGSTPGCSVSDNWEGITEMHPGNYLFYDRQQASIGCCSEDDIAVAVLTRVISHYPERNTLLIDAGALSFSKDLCDSGGFGKIDGFPELLLKKISQEEGVVTTRDPSAKVPYDKLPLGTALKIRPNHSCLAAACFTEYHVLVEDDIVKGVWSPCRGW